MSVEATIFATLSAYSTDVVAIYDENYNPLLLNAKFLKAEINPTSTLMEHPLETGAVSSDHRIINPVEINLPIILPSPFYKETYQELYQLFKNATLLIIQTKADVFNNQMIMDMPHEESPEFFNALVLNVRLKEVQISTNVQSMISPRDPTRSSTVDRGTISPKPVTPEQEERVTTAAKLAGGRSA